MDRAKRSNEVFEDFEWMEKMDEFDKQIQEQIWEEEFIRSCIEQLLEEEEDRETMTAAEILQQKMESEKLEGRKTGSDSQSKVDVFSSNYRNGLSNSFSTTVQSSKLNPNAAVFVPRCLQTSS